MITQEEEEEEVNIELRLFFFLAHFFNEKEDGGTKLCLIKQPDVEYVKFILYIMDIWFKNEGE